MLIMIVAKYIENSKGKTFIKFTKPEWDWHITRKFHITKHKLNHVSRESLADFFHKFAKISELVLVKMATVLEKKFSRMSDMIRGRRVIKNRGSVSFFLKNIEEHKKKL